MPQHLDHGPRHKIHQRVLARFHGGLGCHGHAYNCLPSAVRWLDGTSNCDASKRIAGSAHSYFKCQSRLVSMPTHRRICDQQHRANNNRSHPFSYRGGSPPNHALLFGARHCNRTIDKHVAELCKYSKTIHRLMAINLAKAEERM